MARAALHHFNNYFYIVRSAYVGVKIHKVCFSAYCGRSVNKLIVGINFHLAVSVLVNIRVRRQRPRNILIFSVNSVFSCSYCLILLPKPIRTFKKRITAQIGICFSERVCGKSVVPSEPAVNRRQRWKRNGLLGVTLDYLIKGDRENKPDKLSFSLENIPKEKIGLLCELLNTGLKLCSSCGESPCEDSVEK